jgi:hypothetical protein
MSILLNYHEATNRLLRARGNYLGESLGKCTLLRSPYLDGEVLSSLHDGKTVLNRRVADVHVEDDLWVRVYCNDVFGPPGFLNVVEADRVIPWGVWIVYRTDEPITLRTMEYCYERVRRFTHERNPRASKLRGR